MKKFKGMNFKEWCLLDVNDERKIEYILHLNHIEKTIKFTSDDFVDGLTMIRVQNSYIRKIRLIDDYWHVELDYC